jgi:hypothetical protein
MVDIRLKQRQLNDILSLIQQSELDPSEFEWADVESIEHQGVIVGHRARFGHECRISVLTHRPSKYFCKFGLAYITFSPGAQHRVEFHEHLDVWEVKLQFTRQWLAELRKEVEAPDLWADIGQEKVLSTAASSTDLDNRLFTAAEQSLIAAKLDEIKGYILEEQHFNAEQAEFVQREFADLKESSRRFGRKDWLRVLLGVLISQVINLALTPEKAKGLFALAGTAFQSLWGAVHGYLP